MPFPVFFFYISFLLHFACIRIDKVSDGPSLLLCLEGWEVLGRAGPGRARPGLGA